MVVPGCFLPWMARTRCTRRVSSQTTAAPAALGHAASTTGGELTPKGPSVGERAAGPAGGLRRHSRPRCYQRRAAAAAWTGYVAAGAGFARRPRMATAARADCAVVCEPPCTRTGWALRPSTGRAGPRGRLLSRARWAPEMRGAHTVCRRLRGYWRVLCLSVACERDIISVVSSKPISARHTSPIPLYGTILTARARGGAGRCDAHHSVPPQRTAKRRGAQRAAQRARRSRHAAAARPHPPGSAAARLLAARPELEPDRLVGVVRLWEKERPEGAGLICVPYTPGGRSSRGRSSQRRQPLFAPLRGARPSRAARPCSASV